MSESGGDIISVRRGDISGIRMRRAGVFLPFFSEITPS